MPGLVDTHIHAPQYVNSGIGYDMMLLDWLKTYTFPTEAKFKEIEFARDVYTKAVVILEWECVYNRKLAPSLGAVQKFSYF